MLNEEALRWKVKQIKAYEIRRMGRSQMVTTFGGILKMIPIAQKIYWLNLMFYNENLSEDQKSIVHLARGLSKSQLQRIFYLETFASIAARHPGG